MSAPKVAVISHERVPAMGNVWAVKVRIDGEERLVNMPHVVIEAMLDPVLKAVAEQIAGNVAHSRALRGVSADWFPGKEWE